MIRNSKTAPNRSTLPEPTMMEVRLKLDGLNPVIQEDRLTLTVPVLYPFDGAPLKELVESTVVADKDALGHRIARLITLQTVAEYLADRVEM